MSQPIKISAANFNNEVIGSDVPVILDFWAPWCGPCRAIGPILDELAGEYAGKVKVGKVNVDQERQLAGEFQVRGIPALFVVKDNQIVDEVVGFGGRGALEALFRKHAGKAAA